VMTGIGGWYDYQQTLIMPYGPFGVNISVWGIIIAVLGSLLLIGQMWYRIRELESNKPNILVEIRHTINRDCCLKVINNGEEGSFETLITLYAVRLNGEWYLTEEFSAWRGIWESTNTNNTKIMKGHHDSVKFAHINNGASVPTIELLGYDFNTKSGIVIKDFNCYLSNDSETKVRLSVAISSNPSLKNGAFKKIYEITHSDMAEVKSPKISKVRNPKFT